ncbi:type I restriction enzyme HsdR N-terminal domain-containing protein [Saccharicrinis sp. 156]|uniref:type I restriction enzyme HsdR N-terminal domain-containing protein n=1 Tax=Saccharicrinis sp. 156 TaxID=3417574 RepID=UPI003D3391BD
MYQSITYNDLDSEEDLRTKIVYNWLLDKGINEKEISLEKTFTILLGKGKKTISGRSDILVRKSNGINLFVIEVKKVEHKLNEDDKRQAISYATALDGGIAPFTILTNGKESRIYDSVTKELISNKSIPINHPYIINGFKPSGDFLSARIEALEYLISLSKENLITFCKGQVSFRMRKLKSTDIHSERKYIPQLYIDRKNESKKLKKHLFENGNDLVLVTSPPQNGKTCFLCNTVENYLNENIACLFYPANELRGGLLNTIKEDFNWIQNSDDSPLHIINRLERILRDTNQKLLLFIDGWNELNQDIALQLNEECCRLENRNIKIILSCTSFSVRRLLFDNNSNPEYISDRTGIDKKRADILYVRKLNSDKGAHVQLDDFDSGSLHWKARKIYEAEYNTKIPVDDLLRNPFYLRLFAEIYTNRQDVVQVDNSVLIKKSIISKAIRAGIKEIEALSVLGNLASYAFENGAPIDISQLNKLPGNIDTEKYEDAGLLIFGNPKMDTYEINFYYTIDRNYMISIIHRKWHNLFSIKKSMTDINAELEKCCKNECSLEALKWFLSCPEYIENLKYLYDNHIDKLQYPNVISIIKYSIIQNAELIELDWLRLHISELKPEIIQAFVKNYLSYDIEESEEFIHWFITLIKIDKSLADDKEESETYSLFYDYYGEELKQLAYEGDLAKLERLLQDSLITAIKNNDNVYLNIFDIYSNIFLKGFVEFLISIKNELSKELVLEMQSSLAAVYDEYREQYYGGWCPGAFQGDDDIGDEFFVRSLSELRPCLEGLLYLSSVGENNDLRCCTQRLYENLMYYADCSIDEVQRASAFGDPNQLKLPFE